MYDCARRAAGLSFPKRPLSFSKRDSFSKRNSAVNPDQFWASSTQACEVTQRVDFKVESLVEYSGRPLTRVDSVRRRSWRDSAYLCNPDLHTPDHLKAVVEQRETSPLTMTDSDGDSGEYSMTPPHFAPARAPPLPPPRAGDACHAGLAAPFPVRAPAASSSASSSPPRTMRTVGTSPAGTPTRQLPPRHYVPADAPAITPSTFADRLRHFAQSTGAYIIAGAAASASSRSYHSSSWSSSSRSGAVDDYAPAPAAWHRARTPPTAGGGRKTKAAEVQTTMPSSSVHAAALTRGASSRHALPLLVLLSMLLGLVGLLLAEFLAPGRLVPLRTAPLALARAVDSAAFAFVLLI